jgi:hypothetical protein
MFRMSFHLLTLSKATRSRLPSKRECWSVHTHKQYVKITRYFTSLVDEHEEREEKKEEKEKREDETRESRRIYNT